MLNLTICVVVPAGFASICHKLGRVKYFPLNLMLLGAEPDLKLRKLRRIENSIENVCDSVESLVWVLDFVFVKIAHFSRIRSEIFG